MKVFVSTENTSERRVAEIIVRLRRCPELRVEHSPLNPAIGEDPRWQDWYRRGCEGAIANVDHFIAVESAGYDSSTWMAIELDTALKVLGTAAVPSLFLSKRADRPLPRGFHRYHESATTLPTDPEAAVAAFLVHARGGGSML